MCNFHMLYDRNLRVASDKDFVIAESNVHEEVGIYAYMYIIYEYSYIYIYIYNKCRRNIFKC